MKKVSLIAFALPVALFIASCGETPKSEEPSEVAKDSNEVVIQNNDSLKLSDDIVSAASGNLAEIEIAKTAATKSSDAEIKKLGADLVTAHTGLYEEVKALATSKGITVPAAADEDAAKKAKDLNEAKAGDFDKKWVDELISKHEATVKKYEDFAANTSDAEFKTWLGNTIPKVKEHLSMLEAKKAKLK